MRKVATFEGFINGDRFDDVNAYNLRINELIDAGIEDIQASTSTAVKYVEDEVECDPNLPFLPYFGQNDPKYLDVLVTLDENTNMQNRTNTINLLDKCYVQITDSLYNNSIDIPTKESYLNDVRSIINTLCQDESDNNSALSNIKINLEAAVARLEEAKNSFVQITNKCRQDEFILNSAKPVIHDLLEFYRRIEADALQAIAEQKASNNCNCTRCNDNCTCCHTDVDDANDCCVTESAPEAIHDVESWYDRILRECGLK